MRRTLALLLGLWFGGNGLVMIAAPARWFASVPGLSESGSYHSHLVTDVGIAFSASGGVLLVFALAPALLWPAALAGAAFPFGHALLHLVGIVGGHSHAVALELGAVVVPALLALAVAIPRSGMASWPGFLVRAGLRRFDRRYGYDSSYLATMQRQSPRALTAFLGLLSLSRHREAAPREAWLTARLVGAVAEDCGPCTQLVVEMAREAGMPADRIAAVLARDESAMDEATRIAFRFAEALAYRLEEMEPCREEVRQRWGGAAVIDLTLAVTTARMFPMVKAGMGYARECRRVTLGERPVTVARRAA